jgi:hypothetical protein
MNADFDDSARDHLIRNRLEANSSGRVGRIIPDQRISLRLPCTSLEFPGDSGKVSRPVETLNDVKVAHWLVSPDTELGYKNTI